MMPELRRRMYERFTRYLELVDDVFHVPKLITGFGVRSWSATPPIPR